MDMLTMLIIFCGHFVSHVFTAGGTGNDSAAVQDYDRLKKDLTGRPVIKHKMPADVLCVTSDPCMVTLDLYMVQVQVDEIKQLMTVAGQFSVGWTHQGLTWDPSSYGGIEAVVMATEEMWVPQLAVWIGDRDSMALTYPDTLRLNASGHVSCETLSHVTFRCPIDPRKFPFDTQTCRFTLYATNQRLSTEASVLNLGGEALIKTGSANYEPYGIKDEWVLLNFTVGAMTDTIGQVTPIYILTVRRQRLYYVIVVIVPMVVTSAMIPLVFLIPKDSDDRMSYLVTIYTSSAIFLTYISQVIPKNLSSSIPYLAILLTEVTFLGLLATLAALWVVNKYNSEKKRKSFDDHKSCKEKKNKSLDVKIATQENNQKEEARVQEIQTEPSDMRKDVISETRLTGSQLDVCFFCLFFIGQTVFLLTLFFGTDWLD